MNPRFAGVPRKHQKGTALRHFPTVSSEDRFTKPRHAPIFLSYQIIKTHSLTLRTPRISSECPGSEGLLRCWKITFFFLKKIYFCKKYRFHFLFWTEIDTPGQNLAGPSFQLWGGTQGIICSTLASMKGACVLKRKPAGLASSLETGKTQSFPCCCSEIKQSGT